MSPPVADSSARLTGDTGSALLLVPAAVLVVVAVAVLSVDGGRALAVQRATASAASAVANDVAALGFDRGVYQLDGTIRLVDSGRLGALARARLGSQGRAAPWALEVARLDDRRVQVRVSTSVEPWWGRGPLPGIGRRTVGATAVGYLAGPDGSG